MARKPNQGNSGARKPNQGNDGARTARFITFILRDDLDFGMRELAEMIAVETGELSNVHKQGNRFTQWVDAGTNMAVVIVDSEYTLRSDTTLIRNSGSTVRKLILQRNGVDVWVGVSVFSENSESLPKRVKRRNQITDTNVDVTPDADFIKG